MPGIKFYLNAGKKLQQGFPHVMLFVVLHHRINAIFSSVDL